ncbi:hypothetical protein [Enterococcus sp. 1001283B150225_161107_E12]|uniref:hypothetical protein n=1 Tax=Enterococcus sp. 1001283B150225_161107_E12 TaxID=2787145 RepID=UPI00189CB892|nr:hypothetical protein [Enterococcus sp. 1001283B150225_161107_E12]
MTKKLDIVQRIDSRVFYKDIYRHASSFNSMWIYKPSFIFFSLIVILGCMISYTILVSYILKYFFTKDYKMSENFYVVLAVGVICTLVLILIFKLKRKLATSGRNEKYCKYLYDLKKERLLNRSDINSLISDIDLLIDKEKIYLKKIFPSFRNLTFAVCVPIILYSIQKMQYLNIIASFIIIFYLIIIAFMVLKKSEIYEVLEYILISDYYIYDMVKKELEYMKSIKID